RAGDRGRAIPHLRDAMERDAAMLDVAPNDTARQRLPCRACYALAALIDAYVEGDSLDLAERSARDWTRRQPGNYQAWSMLAGVYELEGRTAEALAAQREAARRAAAAVAAAAAVPAAYARDPTLVLPSVVARRRAWALTLAATARAAAGDTAALGALADSVTAIGSRSGFERVRKLGSYVRGL